MKAKNILAFAVSLALGAIALFPACTKNSNPNPVHDTVTVTKHDTTQLTDTLYASKPDPTVNLKKGLLLYLPFTGNIADSSGNANPTTAVNGASLTNDEHGWANNAFGSNGSNQVILVTNNGSIQFDTAYSISIDVMTMSLSVRQAFLSMIDYNTGNGPSFLLGATTPGMTNLFNYGANDISAGCDNYGQTNVNKISDTTTFTPTLGSWYNIILIYHRGTAQLYLNGNLYHTKTSIGGTLAELCPVSQIVVGGWWKNDVININGKLDNIRLYNRVLTPHEITTLAANYQVNSNQVKPAIKTHS